MKTQLYLKCFILVISCLSLFLTACSDDKENDLVIVPEKPEEPANPISEETLLVNDFIAAYVQDAYLWTSTINWRTVKPEEEPDPFAFFEKLRYKEEDKWSALTDDIKGLSGEFEGVSTTFGYQLIFGRYSDAPEYLFAIVLYVYPDSPAEKAGIKRGNIITGNVFIDGSSTMITEDNYAKLFNASSLILQTGTFSETGGLEVNPTMAFMMAENMYEDPINTYAIIEKGANKIGYLCYTDFTQESENRLLEVFSEFKSQGVTDVVLDLRYNSGGYARTSCLLSSILAPASVVKGKELFVSEQWNDAYMAEFKKVGKNKYDPNDYFTDTLSVNMDLSRIYILTSSFTASASESTIIGMEPYMEVVQIGDTTHGKYCGGVLLSPETWDEETQKWYPVKEIDNWGMYLMVYRFANKNGITSFTGGLVPDISEKENYYELYPFGDERDPLLAQAISQITGEPVVETRSAFPTPPHPIITSIRPMKALDGKMIDTKRIPRLSK